ncbi:S1 family peptidase [Sphingobacterium lumbrici]|uniref:S1 family peptidase n=1 Tax=Sphingobacterium lumbrici TaxID=2559600 RepID=UPI0015E358C6|nr:serine protease [Sphingobacterium lumbrici]
MNKINVLPFLCFILFIVTIERPVFSQDKVFDVAKLEKAFKANIQRSYAASVRVASLDANDHAVGGYFSAVVVDAEGHILTAGHAVIPNNIYQVTFPDGRMCKAKGLGVIPDLDIAMMVILDKGKWPFAEMGWSSVLESNMPCFSIAYPGSFSCKKPTVRFGYVLGQLKGAAGFIRNTCLMEPGDSGGPLFDMQGRVIGTHSRISTDINNNLEAPVDNFRKYWTALQTPKIHTAFIPEDKFKVKEKATKLVPVPQMPQLIAQFSEQDLALRKHVLTITDAQHGSAFGTLVRLEGLLPDSALKGKSYLISKSSLTGELPEVELPGGHKTRATVIARDEANDLVLLQIPQAIAGGIQLLDTPKDYSIAQLGNFLLSPKPRAEGEWSVLGNIKVHIPKSPARYLGVETSFNKADNKIVVTGLHPLSAEHPTTDIAVKDELLQINDRTLFATDDLADELSKFETGQSVTLAYTRKDADIYHKTITLQPRYVKPNRNTDWFVAGRSQRRDNFKEVLVHDGKLKPSECGGPLFDISGNFYGINIARLSRTSSLAIPAPVLLQFVHSIIASGTSAVSF